MRALQLSNVAGMARSYDIIELSRPKWEAEGRNGYLSRIYHNGRGLAEKRLRTLTVIHNYGLKRADGTTAAMRLFGRAFPDLFLWLVAEMDELPLPRKGSRRAIRNPLIVGASRLKWVAAKVIFGKGF